MDNKLEKIILNIKDCYKESVLIDNELMQDKLLNILTELKQLEEFIMNKPVVEEQNEVKSKRYSYEQVKAITKIQLELAKDQIPSHVAEREILKIAPNFPTHNLRQYNKLMKQRLSGIGVYGLRIPSNWAKALLEETNNDKLVTQALNEEQDLYFEKEGRRNDKLDKLLKEVTKNGI
jgi:hypothetical protein